MTLNRPVPIDKTHLFASFDCGVVPLNEYLRKYASVNHQNRSARTFVATSGDQVVGYFTLAAGTVSRDQVPPRVAHGLGQYPVPAILLARLAVDVTETGKGLGAGLLKDAVLRAFQASDLVGCRAILTHAKDPRAANFYQKYGFAPSPVNDLHLYLLMKDVKQIAESPTATRK